MFTVAVTQLSGSLPILKLSLFALLFIILWVGGGEDIVLDMSNEVIRKQKEETAHLLTTD